MSSGGQIVGGIVGAVIGFYIGGPAGAFQGAALGIGIGGYLDPPKGPTVSGPRLNDLAVQTSTYGAHIPRAYAKVGMHGNILWLENNKLKERVRKKESGGKGGGSSQTVKTYTYSATFILALCEGPIAGVQRIWCQDKLIFNAGSDDISTIIASNNNAKGWRVYTGTDDQQPDPRYEADVGVGNAPAFRGMAYIAFYDFQLEDFSNTLQAAQFKVEVVKYITPEQPQLVSSVSMPEPISFEQSSFMYCSSSGVAALYKNRAGTIISRYKVPPSQAASYQGDVMSGNGQLISGVSDEECFATPVDTTGFIVFDKDGLEISQWALTESYAHYIKLYRSNGNEYVVRQLGGSIPVNTTRIYKREAGSILISPELISTTDTSSIYGRISDIFVIDEYIYALTFSKFVLCMDLECNVIWSQDLSSEDIYPSAFSGANDSGIRTHRSDQIYIESIGKFWVVTSSGYQYLGDCGSALSDATHRRSDVVVGGVWICYDSGFNTIKSVNINVAQDELQDLSEVIEDEVSLSSLLEPADLDTSLISEEVRGYRVQGGSIRSALEPLQGVWPFDVIQSGYKVKFVPRGQISSANATWYDLCAEEGSDQDSGQLIETREMDSQLPVITNIKYLDASREYAISEQRFSRTSTEAINLADRELPIVLNANEAAKVAEVLCMLPWLERIEIGFTLPPPFRSLEPSDVVTLTTSSSISEIRLTETNYLADGRIQCKGKPNSASLYDSNALGGEGVIPPGTVVLPGDSVFVPIDIPVVDETLQNSPGFIGLMYGYSESWPGGIALRSADQGQTWSDIQAFTGEASIGLALGALSVSTGTLIDQSTLSVGMIKGEPESITRDQMLSGANYAAYGVNGRWEIVRFQNAVLQVDGTYLVSGFVRGERGTEWATGLHQFGDMFILLADPDGAFIGSAIESIGVDLDYRAVTVGSSVDDAEDVSFTYQGVNLECLSPVYAKGSRDGSGNFTGTFTRRSRLSTSWWTTGVESPVGETSESYEIDVMSGSTVKRTISVTSPSFSYSAADQTTDFGSAQASIAFRIYQLSSVVGRGYVSEVTL